MQLARTHLKRTFRTRPLLRSLGLPTNARWPAVARVVKQRIVEARLSGDDGLAAVLSEAKAFLRRNVFGECRTCGAAVKARIRECSMHAPKQ